MVTKKATSSSSAEAPEESFDEVSSLTAVPEVPTSGREEAAESDADDEDGFSQASGMTSDADNPHFR